MKMRFWTVIISICTLIAIGQAGIGAQSQPESSTLDGVFTSEQAGRGRQIVINIGCADCHNSDLGGGLEETPSLVGNEFIAIWKDLYLKDLDSQLTAMPKDSDYRLSPQERADIMAFLLGINGAPVGKTELPTDPAVLARIKIKFP
jgi:hypothetical protein